MYNTAWPFQGKPGSDHAVLTAAMYSYRAQLASDLVSTTNIVGNRKHIYIDIK